jgi:hypothetical protein
MAQPEPHLILGKGFHADNRNGFSIEETSAVCDSRNSSVWLAKQKHNKTFQIVFLWLPVGPPVSDIEERRLDFQIRYRSDA